MNILGISAFYHDSAACLVRDGEIIAAAQEERFTRLKHDARFPRHAIQYCLREAGIDVAHLDIVTFYDKPFVKFERLLETYIANAPKGFRSFHSAMPIWIKEKLYLKTVLKKELKQVDGSVTNRMPRLLFAEHHQSHAASAFFAAAAALACLASSDLNTLSAAWVW